MSKKQSSNQSGPQQLFYTEAFKRKIVNEVLSCKLNKHQASKIYGIKGNATILYRVRQGQGLKGFEKGAKTIGNFESGYIFGEPVYFRIVSPYGL